MSVNLSHNLATLRTRIAQSASQHQRDLNDIQLLAVSKTKPVSDLMQGYEAGLRAFGENYVQEGVEKIQTLAHLQDIEWHFIGPLQSNKTKAVAEHFDWVQSVSRLKIAQRLSDQRPVFKAPLNICIQVNIDNELNKAGVSSEDTMQLIEQIHTLPKLKLRGLMAIPAATKEWQEQYESASKLRELFQQCQQAVPEFDTLSIGMSQDMDAAIAAGSTMLRIGTALFGARN